MNDNGKIAQAIGRKKEQIKLDKAKLLKAKKKKIDESDNEILK